jgi:D-alanyl-D-alanine carboxypeptidase/D-alanyl-D-alanine-endopeptidase (penicillin-binding protein 4)
MKRLLWLFIILISFQTQASNVLSVFGQKKYRNSINSICVIDHSTGKIISSYNKDVSVVPASVMKLVTTATALELLGPEYKFKTRIEYTGRLVDGTLDGNLLIIGGGDPTLGSRHFNKDQQSFLNTWTEEIKKAGIKKINGDIIAYSGLFDNEPVSPYWIWEDIGNYYAAGIYGLGVFDNSYQITFRSGKPGSIPEISSLKPEIPGLIIENRLKAADNNKDSAYIYGVPFQNERYITGTIPCNRETFSIRGDIPNPPAFIAQLIKQTLIKEGIQITGKSFAEKSLPDKGLKTVLVYTHLSENLLDIISKTNEKSDNVYAEYLLRHIALSKKQFPATSKDGLGVIRDYWTNQGLDLNSLVMLDGSGLSPIDRISSELLAKILDYELSKGSYGNLFEKSLPIAGLQGSVASFLKDSQITGKVRVKSGTMQGVTCYAGYYRKKDKIFVFAMLSNHLNIPRSHIVKEMEDCLLSL